VVLHTPPLDLEVAQRIGVPLAWLEALTEAATIPEQILTLWAPLAKWMPRTRRAYSARCVALVAVQTGTHPLSLLYCFDLGKSWTAQRGFLPGRALPAVAGRFPVDLGPLYALHNGLVDFVAEEDGPVPMEKWRSISDQRGGALIEVLSEGGRGFGFDIAEDPVRAYWLDADDEEDPVQEVDDTWAFLDEFMAQRLEK